MTVRTQLRHCLGAMALIGALTVATACTPNNQPNGPSTPPSTAGPASTSSTPTPTPSPTPTGVTEADKKAAIQAIVKANEIIDDALIARAKTFPKTLDIYLDPKSDAYKDQFDSLVESYTEGWHQTARTTVTQAIPTPMANGDIDLFACIDGTNVITNYPNLGPRNGVIVAGHFVVSKVGSDWKITAYGTPKIRKVKSCNEGR